MATSAIKKVRCQHFEVPCATVRYKRWRIPFPLNRFSQPYSLINLSVGGMSFECDRKLAPGMEITVQLLIPGSRPLSLKAKVGWDVHLKGEMTSVATINFLPFGRRKGGNSHEALERLRRLEQEYGKDEDQSQFNPVRDHLF